MKKAVSATLLLLYIALYASAQVSFERHILATAGSAGSAGNIVFQYTIGETVALTTGIGDIFFTQGFQQPQIIFTPTKDVHFEMAYIVYPNPAAMQVNIEITTNRIGELVLSLYSIDGKLLQSGRYEIRSSKTITLDVSGLTPATYFLSLYDPAANAFATEPLQVVR